MVCRKGTLLPEGTEKELRGNINLRRYKEFQCDIITGGFPCQDISNAGKRAGIEGARSGLWKDMLETIRLVRPKYAVVENVSDLRNRGMGTVLGDLAQAGYDAEWDCLQAREFGAPHKRERIFIIAYSNCERAQICIEERLSQNQVSSSTSQKRVITNPYNIHDWQQRKKSLYEKNRNEIWAIESMPCGVDDGVSNGIHRLRSLGNAVVPQCAEFIAMRIKEIEQSKFVEVTA